MEAKIVSFRRGRKTQTTNQVIIMVGEQASNLIGKEVIWESSSKKKIKGKITSLHGRKGCVRALFEKGLPGQSITQKVKIII